MKKAISAICCLAIGTYCMTSAVVNAESEKLDQISANIPEGTTILVGDIDTSGIVDLTDMSTYSLYMIGDLALSDDQKIYADTNLDEVLDMCDLADYGMYFAKKVSEGSDIEIGETIQFSSEGTEKEPEKDDSEVTTTESKPAEQKSEKVYSTEETKEMLKYLSYYNSANCTIPIYTLDKEYPVEELVTPNNSAPYCIYQLESEKKMYVFFENKTESLRQVVAVFIYDDKLLSEDFSVLKKGMTLADVEKVDASTKFMDSVANYPLGAGHTLHMTKDGFVKITYGEITEENFEDYFADYYPAPANPERFVISSVEFIPNGGEMSVVYVFEDTSFRFTVLDEDR